MIIYATGAPIRFADRSKIEQVLARSHSTEYGIRSVVHEIVQSELFCSK
ncbi:MAG: DUF1585 domain-containing protein [Verrucomicrobia bacterium]|nr:DUF1585 domain-containing protein [Verrucomicrobiota bacterium]